MLRLVLLVLTSVPWCYHGQHSRGGLVDGVEAEAESSKAGSLQCSSAQAAAAAAVATAEISTQVQM
jgi:hypothetical protein